MASIVKRAGKRGTRWQVKTKDAAGKQASETFDTLTAAKDRAAELRQLERRGGGATVARAGGWCFDEWADQCLTEWRGLSEASQCTYGQMVRLHLVPFFRSAPLHKIDRLMIERWVSAQDCAPATLGLRFSLLRRIFRHALRHQLIQTVPTVGVELPRNRTKKRNAFLTVDHVELLADAIDPELRAYVYLGAYCGLRPGELYVLRWSDLDVDHRDLDGAANPLVRVARTSTRTKDGVLREGTGTKTAASAAAVPIPVGNVLDELLLHHTRAGGDPDGLVFPAPRGRFWRSDSFVRTKWAPALTRARALARARDVRPFPARVVQHTLRHTAVALWIKAGADAKEVSERARHASVAYTLDTYGGLFPDRGRQVDRALDALIGAARLVDHLSR